MIGAMNTKQRLLIADEVAEILAISPRQVTRLMNAGHIPTVRVTNSALRVPLEDLCEWIQARIDRPSEISALSAHTGRAHR